MRKRKRERDSFFQKYCTRLADAGGDQIIQTHMVEFFNDFFFFVSTIAAAAAQIIFTPQKSRISFGPEASH